MKKKRAWYIDPLWLAFLLAGVAIGLLIGMIRPAEAAEPEVITVVKEVPVEIPAAAPVYAAASAEPEEPAEPKLESLGWFTITAYCPCEKCCGKTPDDPWYGITATGTTATQGRTVAVDPDVIPYGSVVYFEGADGLIGGYVAEDCGGAIRGNRIDLFFDDHQAALEWGVREQEVFFVEEMQ